jgi:D-alanyl-D-alanine carboxypeptidase
MCSAGSPGRRDTCGVVSRRWIGRRKGLLLAALCALTVVAVFGAVLLGGWGSSRSRHAIGFDPARRAAIGNALRALIATGVPGAVMFARDDRGAVVMAAGVSDIATATPMSTAARFRVASITKSFIAVVVLQLVADGSFSLDEPVDQVVPGLLAPAFSGITVRELLDHTSGLPDFADDWRWYWPYFHGDPGHRWKPRQLLAFAVAHRPLFEPGLRWGYSNTNYVVLGLIVEAVTGQRLGAEIKERLITPLGLRSTTFDTGSKPPPQLAHGYTQFDSYIVDSTRFSPSAWWAAGAIVSSASDLARFYGALLHGYLLAPRLMAAMETLTPTGKPGVGAGLGLFRTRSIATLSPALSNRCSAGWGHSGQIDGYLSAAFASRDAGRQYVLLIDEDPSAFPPGGSAAVIALAAAAFC